MQYFPELRGRRAQQVRALLGTTAWELGTRTYLAGQSLVASTDLDAAHLQHLDSRLEATVPESHVGLVQQSRHSGSAAGRGRAVRPPLYVRRGY